MAYEVSKEKKRKPLQLPAPQQKNSPEEILKSETESEKLELKAAEGGFPEKALWDYLAALANEKGGLLLLGRPPLSGMKINCHIKSFRLLN